MHCGIKLKQNMLSLLMLSGIGPAEELERFHVSVAADLPVGKRFQDRCRTTGVDFTVKHKSFTHWEELLTQKNLENYIKNYTGPLSHMMYEHQAVMVNLKSNVSRDPTKKHGLFGLADCFFEPTLFGNPIGILSLNDAELISPEILEKYYGPHANKNVATLPMALGHVKSRGSITLTRIDPFDPPLVDPNYLSHPEDLDRLVDCTLLALEFENTAAFKALGAKAYPEKLPGCEEFEKNSRPYVECMVKTLSGSELHMGSSCPMGGEGDKWAVVDCRLKVYKMENLRVCDASIMPFITNGNLMAATIMIAEKGADMIKEDYYY